MHIPPWLWFSFDRLAANGNVYLLVEHLGNPDTTMVGGEHYVSPAPTGDLAGVRYPDLFVAFDVDPAAYRRSNAYVISEQGKLPDFVLEIASRRTGRIDVTEKRRDYAALGIGEYWRFDDTGQHHGTRLAGERLVEGGYVAIDIEELRDGSLQGYSLALKPEHPLGAGRVGVLRPGYGLSHRYPVGRAGGPAPPLKPALKMLRPNAMPSRKHGLPLRPGSESWKSYSATKACNAASAPSKAIASRGAFPDQKIAKQTTGSAGT